MNTSKRVAGRNQLGLRWCAGVLAHWLTKGQAQDSLGWKALSEVPAQIAAVHALAEVEAPAGEVLVQARLTYTFQQLVTRAMREGITSPSTGPDTPFVRYTMT
jgi:hypothetical protein